MLKRPPFFLVAILSVMIGCSSCSSHTSLDGGNTQPPWELTWQAPPEGVPTTIAPADVLSRYVKIEHFTGNGAFQLMDIPTDRVVAITTSSSRAIALIQIDPSGKQQGIAILTANTTTLHWDFLQLGVGGLETCANGSHSPVTDPSIILPDVICSEGNNGSASQPFHYDFVHWDTAAHFYLLGKFAQSAQQSAQATPLTVAGQQGWYTAQGHDMTVVVPLDTQTTFFFVSPLPLADTSALVNRIYPHMAQLIPDGPPAHA